MPVSRRTLLGAVAGGGVLGAAACGDGKDGKSAATAAPPAGQAGLFGGTDLAWVEINIAMNEQLLPLLALAPTKASSADVKSFVSQVDMDTEQELTGALNWFFRSHANKITLDVSRIQLEQLDGPTLSRSRARLQWDVHF